MFSFKFNFKLRSFLFFCFFFVFFNVAFAQDLEIFSPKYFEENENVYKPIHYLKDEVLSFKFCEKESKYDVENLSVVLRTLKKDVVLEYGKWTKEKNCFFANYDLNNLSADRFELFINYKIFGKEKEIKREFEREKESQLINFILSDKPKSTTDLAYKLLVSDSVNGEDSDLSERLYNVLKNERNNVGKCWPKKSCSLVTTAKNLFVLSLGRYDKDNRLFQDGAYYVNDQVLVDDDERLLKFKIEMQADDDFNETKCVLEFDDEDGEFDEKRFEFDDDESVSKSMLTKFEISCDHKLEELEVKVYNTEGMLFLHEEKQDVSSFEYSKKEIDCLGIKECNYLGTIFSLSALGDLIDNKENFESYVDTLAVPKSEDDESLYLVFSTDRFYDSAFFLFYKNHDRVVDYLKYKQNNDGSWDVGSRFDKIKKTAFSILALDSREVEKEYLEDGKDWIYYNEPSTGWGSLEANSLAYLAIEEKLKPYLELDSFNQIQSRLSLNLSNPTIYELKDVTIDFGDLNEFLIFKQDLGDLNKEDSLQINVSVKDSFNSVASDFFTVSGVYKDERIEILKVPFLISSESAFKIFSDEAYFTSLKQDVVLKVENNYKTGEVWDCNVVSQGFVGSFKLRDDSKSFKFSNSANFVGDKQIEFECSANGKSFSMRKSVELKEIEPTFKLLQGKLIVNDGDDVFVEVKNLKSSEISLNAELDSVLRVFLKGFDEQIVLAGNETKKIFFNVTDESLIEGLNGTKGFVDFSDGKYSEGLKVEVLYEPKTMSRSLKLFLYFVLLVGMIVMIEVVLKVKKNLEQRQEKKDKKMHDEFSDEFVEL